VTVLGRLLRLAARGPSLTILSYHRVLAQADPFLPEYPTQAEFAAQLKAAQRFLRFVPLVEGWEAVRSASTREHLATVTFDDGYRDNLDVALPVLEALQIPATLFLATAYTAGQPFFVDRVTESIARTTEQTLRGADIGLPNLELSRVEQRRHATNTILELLKYRAPADRDALALEIQRRLKLSAIPRLMMNENEVREAHERGMRIAAHMHRHAIMTTVSEEENRRDLAENVHVIESITGVRPHAFAYPNGRSGSDFTALHRELVMEHGFDVAVTTEYGICTQFDAPLLLPRYTPWDRNRVTFAPRLLANISLETRPGVRNSTGSNDKNCRSVTRSSRQGPMRLPSKRPTYLFVLPWSLVHLGGVNQVVINLAKEMIRHETFEPIILVADWHAPNPVWEVVHGLRTVRWRVRPSHAGMKLKERVAFLLWKKSFSLAFKRFCDEHQVAAINLHYPNSSAFTIDHITSQFETRIPLIFSFHGEDLSGIRRSPTDVMKEWKKLLQHADAIVVCSNDLGSKIVEIFGEKVNLRVIYNGLDAEAFVAMASTSKSAQKRTILNVAKFEVNKGQDVLIEAFATIAQTYRDVDLILVGAEEKELPSLIQLSVQRGIQERVHFFPNIPHKLVADFFQRATLFALPSRIEPFGIVLLEAGAFRLPVVASSVGGIPEILTDSVTGLLVPPDNPAALAVGIQRLLDSPAFANAMGARLHQHVQSQFKWTVAYEKYVSLISGASTEMY